MAGNPTVPSEVVTEVDCCQGVSSNYECKPFVDLEPDVEDGNVEQKYTLSYLKPVL
ncbi:hypothetical protein J6590_015163 [Homalodisca vitripennis]|nr:hypothetical protein J6590_015163 [Homalodisca vitripennis]